MVYFAPQHDGAKEWQREKWFWLSFTVFSVEKPTTEKYKNQQSNLPLGPPNALTLEETKENHAACL